MLIRTARYAALLPWIAGAGVLSGQSYHISHRYTLGGDGGWDYVALDTAGHRLFIARSDRVMVVDPETGTLLGEIAGLERAHGIAFAYAAGHGFATSGGDGSVVMFDLKTLAVLGRTRAAPDADAILFDPSTGRIFTFNGDAHSSTALDAASGRRIGAVEMGATPEFGVATGGGTLFVNLESTSEIAEIDAAALKVTRRWPLAPCQGPTGLAIDQAHHRLFSGCRNGILAVSDATAGKLVTTAPIGRGVDGCRFDPATGLAFASNGDGTLSIVREVTPDSFNVAAAVVTKPGARTLELDLATHRVYTVSADFTPARGIVPGSFALLMLEP